MDCSGMAVVVLSRDAGSKRTASRGHTAFAAAGKPVGISRRITRSSKHARTDRPAWNRAFVCPGRIARCRPEVSPCSCNAAFVAVSSILRNQHTNTTRSEDVSTRHHISLAEKAISFTSDTCQASQELYVLPHSPDLDGAERAMSSVLRDVRLAT